MKALEFILTPNILESCSSGRAKLTYLEGK